MRGLSDAYGSWNTICMRRRSGRIAAAVASAISCPAKRIDPAVGSWMRTMRRAKVDLPQPDSPTRPTVSPAATSRSTPSTARTTFAGAEEAVARQREMLDQAAHRQQRLGGFGGSRSAARRRARARRSARVAGGGSGSPDCVTQQRALRPGANSSERRMLVALRDPERTARREAAARRDCERIGRRALDGGQPARRRAGAGRSAAPR